MADEVQVFYNDLINETAVLEDSVSTLIPLEGALQGGDVGVENPAYRASLRLEMRRRIDALHDTVGACVTGASGLSGRLQGISGRFSDLDAELTGTGQP